MEMLDILALIGVSSIISSIITFFLSMWQKKSDIKFEKSFNEKQNRYRSTLAFMLIVLDTKNMKHVDISQTKKVPVDDKEIKSYFLDEVKAHANFSYLYASESVLKSLEQFISKPSEDTYKLVAKAMGKDLWIRR